MIGHRHSSPYGAVTDMMVENRAGHRTLSASTPQLAEFLAGSTASSSPRRRLQHPGIGLVLDGRAGPPQLSFTIGRRLLGWLLWATGQPPRARHNPEPPIVQTPGSVEST